MAKGGLEGTGIPGAPGSAWLPKSLLAEVDCHTYWGSGPKFHTTPCHRARPGYLRVIVLHVKDLEVVPRWVSNRLWRGEMATAARLPPSIFSPSSLASPGGMEEVDRTILTGADKAPCGSAPGQQRDRAVTL